MWVRLLVSWLGLALSFPAVAETTSADCMPKYYVTKPESCIDSVVAQIRATPPNKPVSPGAVGFVGAMFRTNPVARARLLASNDVRNVNAVYHVALYMADLKEDAEAFGKAKGFLQPAAADGLSLTRYRPTINPADNDMLIGAYMASGNKDYISRILSNFTDAPDGMVADALRISFVQSKFGAKLAPPGRQPTFVMTACERYSCKADKAQLFRVLTLSSAFWALRSLSKADDGIKSALTDFIASNVKFKTVLATEQTAFDNYITGLIAFAGIKDNANINESLGIYERLGPAMEAVNALVRKN